MKKGYIFFCLAMLLAAWSPVGAQDLLRRASLGTALEAVQESLPDAFNPLTTEPVKVTYVVEGSSASQIGILAGDIILSVNNMPLQGVSWFVQKIGGLRESDPIHLQVIRQGQFLELSGVLKGTAPERSAHAEVIYNAVPYDGGLLRTIIHKPYGEGKRPVVFYIQGYDCSSVDNLREDDNLRRMLEGFSQKGYVVVKTEKPGVGDSRGGQPCAGINLHAEIKAFEASFNALQQYDFMDLQNVFIFGFSAGGVAAPLLQTDFSPKGIAVFGTVIRPWFDYFTELVRIQRLLAGQDYLVNEANYPGAVKFFYHFMVEQQTPQQLLQDPEMADFMTSFFTYDGEAQLNGRHYTYWQQLQHTRLFEAWSRTPAHVLSLWGAGDVVAFNPLEHQLIADVVNHYQPGKARFVKIPHTDHGLNYVQDQKHSMEIWNDYDYRANNFNPAIIEVTHQWMQEVMQGQQEN